MGPRGPDAAPDPWAGLSVGAGISVWGGKGVKGGVGGDTDLTYEHVFDNGIMLGVQASTGYMPFLQSSPGFTQFTGSAFAGGSAIIGYNFGQVTPYIMTGVDFIRPTRFGVGAFNAGDAVNSVFSGPGAVQAVGTVGVGVNYRITSNFSMGVEAIVHTNPPAAAHSRRGRSGALVRAAASRETSPPSLNDAHARSVPPGGARQLGGRLGRAIRRPREGPGRRSAGGGRPRRPRSATRRWSNGRATSPPRRSTRRFPRCRTVSRISISTRWRDIRFKAE